MLRDYYIKEKYKRDLNIIKTKHLKAFSLKIIKMKILHLSNKLVFWIKTFSVDLKTFCTDDRQEHAAPVLT